MDAAGVGKDVSFHNLPLDRRKSTTSVTGDGDQGDTCRICRGEGTVDQPLFYPCKCSGSIKFVHQECLMEWLSHSQKKYCELCKTPFRFTKLYDRSMPETLPLPLFLRQVGLHAFRTSGRWLRYVFVTFIWTCWLPWSIRQIWRGLFWLADGSWMNPQDFKYQPAVNLASAVVNATNEGILGTSTQHTETIRAQVSSSFDPLTEIFNLLTGAPLLRGLLRLFTSKPTTARFSPINANKTGSGLHTTPSFARQPSLLSNVSSLNSLTNYQFVNNGLVDILEGQLICLSVIAVFILVFLIREWVINQQPILNMPNPDRAEAQNGPVPPPNEDARQQARRRRRGGFRRPHDHDRQPENLAADVAQRRIAVPRPHRATTDETIAVAQTPTYALERPNVPVRSSSLASGPTNTEGMFHMDLDREGSWYTRNLSENGDLESPPLQRGMLDEVVDIRRNIEERIPPISEDSSDDVPYDFGARRVVRQYTPSSDSSALGTGEFSADGVERSDFVFGRNWQQHSSHSATNEGFTFSSTFEVQNGLPAVEGDAATRTAGDEPSNQNTSVRDQSPIPGSDGRQAGHEHTTPIHHNEGITSPESPNRDEQETQDGDEDATPHTLFGRILQWMWHTDEHVRVEADAAEQAETDAIGGVLEQDHLVPRGNVNAPHAAQAPVNPVAHEPNVQFGIDLNDPNAMDDAEDLEGILELVGMEGPLTGMIQNIIFSVFLITLTLSASVWCPYIWGKIAILIMSNPVGVFFKAPLFFISRCGNILVDLLLFIGGLIGYGLSNFTKLIRIVVAPALPSVAAYIKVAAIESWSYGISQNSGARLEKAFSGTVFGLRPDLPTFSMQSHHALRIFRRASVEAFAATTTDILGTFKDASNMWQKYGVLGLPVFVFNEIVCFPKASLGALHRIGEWCYTLGEDLRLKPLSEMVEPDLSLVEWTTEDKVLAIFVGYIFFAAAGFAYLKIAHAALGLKKEEKVDGMFADSLRQAGGVLKVIIIIGIEMIIFPLYCGLLLDCALLPLFENATFHSRFGFLLNAPVTCLFIHWFIGTCYMFHFALFVSMCRKIMRKGVLYFIRDPDDPTFHPVRDVLERPVATQLGKIAFSALVYGGLVMICLGGVVWTIGATSNTLPLHWATNEPRLAFPVDIVFYNFMLPFILRKAEPSKKIAVMYEWWFRQCARKLRLSHFLFGEEHEDEKHTTQPFWKHDLIEQESISNIVSEGLQKPVIGSIDERAIDGRYVRAPAADSVRIPKGTRVFVEVNERNERIDGQVDHDTGMHGKKDDRFAKIYVPPHFRARLSIFVFLVWVFAASTGMTLTVMPLLIGRGLIYRATGSSSAPNDLYAFTLGMHLCAAVTFISYMAITRMDKLQSKATTILTNTKETIPRLYQGTKHVLGLIYLFTTIFIVLPFATSLLTELYIHMPIYSYFANAVSTKPAKPAVGNTNAAPINPTIFVLQTWTLGLLYLRLSLRILISYPSGQNRPSTALRAITRNGYLHPDVSLASRALILPALTICIVLLAAPPGLARMIITITRTADPSEKLHMYRYSYPFVLGMAVTAYTAIGLQQKIEGWRVKIRDEVYLVGEKLHNFSEPENKKKKTGSQSKGKDKEKVRVVQIVEPSPLAGVEPQRAQIVGHRFDGSDNVVASGSSRT